MIRVGDRYRYVEVPGQLANDKQGEWTVEAKVASRVDDRAWVLGNGTRSFVCFTLEQPGCVFRRLPEERGGKDRP